LRAAERSGYQVKLIEPDRTRCTYLAAELDSAHALILHGDSTDEDLLAEEGVDQMDLFVALTSDDETNIMSCMLAKRMGARRTIALINRQAYADLVEGNRIDIGIVPAQATIGQLLKHVRRGDVVAVHSLRRGAAEALEAIAHGDRRSSRVVGRRIEEIDLPNGARIGAIVRRRAELLSTEGTDPAADAHQVIIAHHDTVIEPEDHVIVFVSNKRLLPRVERLFQVGIGFF
jgi:trk system potassium uptake protein TrkA